jgi:hypothetical protein
MSATGEHMLQECGFAIAAALFGTSDPQTVKLPNAALQNG